MARPVPCSLPAIETVTALAPAWLSVAATAGDMASRPSPSTPTAAVARMKVRATLFLPRSKRTRGDAYVEFNW